MKVICINSAGYHLTVGKIYDVSDLKDDRVKHLFQYLVKNDKDFTHAVEESIFKDLNMVREEKLNELGI